MKSQSALEFMTIVAVGLALIAISSFFGFDYITSYSDNMNTINADEMTDNIISAVNLVYSQGVSAQTKVLVNVPPKVVLNRTYLGKNEINLRLSLGKGYSDVFKKTSVNMAGSIPFGEGQRTLYVKMMPSNAIIFSDSPVSYAIVKLFNDSSRTNESYNFTDGQTVYYSVYTYDFNDNVTNSNIVIKVYKPNMAQHGITIETASEGIYNGSFILGEAEDNGTWIVSVTIPEYNLLSTALFEKY